MEHLGAIPNQNRMTEMLDCAGVYIKRGSIVGYRCAEVLFALSPSPKYASTDGIAIGFRKVPEIALLH
jgi:hypothetical protein